MSCLEVVSSRPLVQVQSILGLKGLFVSSFLNGEDLKYGIESRELKILKYCTLLDNMGIRNFSHISF